MTRRYRPRKEFKFWLYHDLTEDLELMEYIVYLRRTRQFARILRNGLRLMWSLGQGDLTMLFELFPTLRSQLEPDNSVLIAEFRQLLESQSRVEQPTSLLPSSPKPLASFKPLALSLPNEDNDPDTLVLKKSTVSTSSNFLSGMMSFNS